MKKKLTGSKLLIGNAAERADIQYATGFHAPDAVVFLKHGRKKYLLVPSMEYNRARKDSTVPNVLTPETVGVPKKKRGDLSEWVVSLLRYAGVDCARVSASFPHLHALACEKAGIQIEPVATGSLFPERAVKSKEELQRIRQAQEAAVLAMRSTVRLIEESEIDPAGRLRKAGNVITSEFLQFHIEEVLLSRNCQGNETIVACGAASADPHEKGSGPIVAGQPVVIDIFPRHRIHGYWGDLTRTVIKGRPSRRLQQMYQAVKSAQKKALQMLKPGISTHRVHQAVHDEFTTRGFKTQLRDGRPEGFFHSTGHGVGLDIHEPPSIGMKKIRLRKGHVITIEPGLYYPDIGGIRIEDTVYITENGWRYLVPCEKRFQLEYSV